MLYVVVSQGIGVPLNHPISTIYSSKQTIFWAPYCEQAPIVCMNGWQVPIMFRWRNEPAVPLTSWCRQWNRGIQRLPSTVQLLPFTGFHKLIGIDWHLLVYIEGMTNKKNHEESNLSRAAGEPRFINQLEVFIRLLPWDMLPSKPFTMNHPLSTGCYSLWTMN